ncbi:hypothetical protein RclHR1_02960008 [Rhizophagus clarus]|uniref:Anucleate primary sterigmata protein b n=1 Tax=Rhizophagus clarus TaxID=94130 RepID=A0A2Z6R5D0_9GLOM|nr:hypothetical protein RclHR1_02960008 [Rhizophagus clarus]GES89290.1 anucleate primary sterigmata protein b [Rhizophagus clarus]
MTESSSPTINDEGFDFDDLSFGSITNFAKGLDHLEKNVSSFLDMSKQPTSSSHNSIQENGNSTRELNPDDNKVVYNVSRLLNNEDTANGRRISDASDARSIRNRRNNNPRPNAPSRNAQMTLKEQEKVIDEIKKENLNLKMQIYFLEERINKMSPDGMERALKENVDLKMQNQELMTTLKQRDKLLGEAENAIQALQATVTTLQDGGISPSVDTFDSKLNSELQNYKDLLQKEKDEKQSILEEANGLKRQLLDVKNKMQETNIELEKLQAAAIKNFEGLQNGEKDNIDNREMIRRIEVAAEKERQEEAEKHSVLIQQLKGQISNLKSQLASQKSENEDLITELDLIRSHPMSSASSRIMNGEFSDQYEESLGLLRDKVAELTLQHRNKSVEVEQLLIKLETANNTIQDLEDEMDRMEAELREEYIHGQDNEQLIVELNAMNHDYQEDLAYSQETITELKLQIDNHKREIAELTEDLDKAHSDLEIKARNVEQDEKVHEELVSDLREKLNMSDAKITELTAVKESTDKQLDLLRQEVENYTTQIDEMKKNLHYEVEQRNASESREKELIAERNKDRELHEKELEKALRDKKDNEKQTDQRLNELMEKLSAAQQQISDLNTTIQERDADLQFVRQQLNNQAGRNKDTTERYSKEQERLRMELDTVRQESERLRTQFEMLCDELENKKNQIIEHENEIKHLNNQRTKLNEKLSSSESARNKAEEVFRNLQLDIRDKNSLIDELKAQVTDLENNLSQEKKVTYSNETQYHDQIIERNKLLMTTYQYLDNIMSDGANKQSNYPKPSANFGLFNEHLLSKLKTLTHVHNTFDRRAKEIDNRWQEQYESLKNQMDIKLRLLNKLEGTVHKATATQKDWREQAKRNQGELEAAKNMNEELTDQLSIMREQLDELKTANSRAEEAESKLRESERRARNIESKMKEEERKWTGRLKDSEYREKQSEERLKVEKQGAKEKVESLIENIKDLETQIQALNRRNNQLQELISIQKASMEVNNESKAIAAKAEQTFSMLNEQLREQLEEKNKTIDAERKKFKELQDQFLGIMEEHKRLQAQIEKREAMLTKVLNGLQIINQRKDVIESAVLRKDLEEMQNSLMLDGKRTSYQRPPFINPPWKPGGINTNTINANNKKPRERTALKASAIPSAPTSSSSTSTSKLRNSTLMKSQIPTRTERSNSHSTNNSEGSSQPPPKQNKETK